MRPDHPSQVLYLWIADSIAARIATGRYPAKLPSERDLAREYEVSYLTLRHATRVLRERGLIINIHGKGTYIAPQTPDTT